jgi:hypothetical protein
VGPRTSLDCVERGKTLPLLESDCDPSAAQPVASCYTSCAILALEALIIATKTTGTISLLVLHIWETIIQNGGMQ